MAQNAYDALGAVPASWPALRAVIVAQSGLAFANPAAVPNTTCAPALEIRVAGVAYFYDAADTTTAHDGAAVLVSEDGRRYKLGSPQFGPNRVESYGNTPPGSPSLGLAYLIGAAPSGAWAAHAGKVAIWTVSGWVFIAPANIAGRLLYVAAEDATYQYTVSGWRKGLGAGSLSEGVIWAENLAPGLARFFIIENQTTNTPPASPAEGEGYIIGPSPTGAWAGLQFRVAFWLGGAWRVYFPFNGFLAWDRARQRLFVWRNASGWVDPVASGNIVSGLSSSILAAQVVRPINGPSNSASAPWQYTYADGTPPTVTARRVICPEIAVTLQSSGASRRLTFEWDGIDLAQSPATPTAVAIFRDVETTAIAWGQTSRVKNRLMALTDDGNSHTYTLCFTTDANLAQAFTLHKNASFSVMESP